MVIESTGKSGRIETGPASQNISELESEIDRSRQRASDTIEEIRSRAKRSIRDTVREKASKALSKTEKAAEKTADAARKGSRNLKRRIDNVNRKTLFYVVGGILAAGSVFTFMSARKRYNSLPAPPVERDLLDVERSEEILREAKEEGMQDAGEEHVIVTPAEDNYEEASQKPPFGRP